MSDLRVIGQIVEAVAVVAALLIVRFMVLPFAPTKALVWALALDSRLDRIRAAA